MLKGRESRDVMRVRRRRRFLREPVWAVSCSGRGRLSEDRTGAGAGCGGKVRGVESGCGGRWKVKVFEARTIVGWGFTLGGWYWCVIPIRRACWVGFVVAVSQRGGPGCY